MDLASQPTHQVCTKTDRVFKSLTNYQYLPKRFSLSFIGPVFHVSYWHSSQYCPRTLYTCIEMNFDHQISIGIVSALSRVVFLKTSIPDQLLKGIISKSRTFLQVSCGHRETTTSFIILRLIWLAYNLSLFDPIHANLDHLCFSPRTFVIHKIKNRVPKVRGTGTTTANQASHTNTRLKLPAGFPASRDWTRLAPKNDWSL